MFTLLFWKQALERAIKMFAGSAIGVLSGDGIGVLNANWGDAFSVAGMAAIVSVLLSVASSQLGAAKDSPSLVPTTPEQERAQS
jgi:hypothetical protein